MSEDIVEAVVRVHGGVKFYRGAPRAVRVSVERDRSRADDYYREAPMKQVRRSEVETWIKQMDAAGLAPGTIKTRYVNVRSVFRAAVKDRVIGADPTDAVRLARGRRADVAMSSPTPEDGGQLMAVADERFRPFIARCAFAGLRLGEAAGVQLGDVDFLRRSLKVSRQVQRVNGGAIGVRAPRYGSERVVYLADSLVTVLANHDATPRHHR